MVRYGVVLKTICAKNDINEGMIFYMLEKMKLKAKSVKIEGKGAIILTGPSGCGKGEVAKHIFEMFALDEKLHLSMGQMLRNIIAKSRNDDTFLVKLGEKYKISTNVSIFDETLNHKEVIEHALSHKKKLKAFIDQEDFFEDKHNMSQYAWLCYTVSNGLLVPELWTRYILEAAFNEDEALKNEVFLIDGYPRTIPAARHMLSLFKDLNIPIIKVVHLYITKNEMLRRAGARNRIDDKLEALENRFQFYIDKVQPSIDEMKRILGNDCVALIDAHQPVFNEDGQINVEESIKRVATDVINSLGISF